MPHQAHGPAFDDLGLVDPILRAVREEGYETPSPVQREVLPHALAGRDVLAQAQTGTGKTAAFLLPILQTLSKSHEAVIRTLVVAPTRELAAQIGERARAYGRYLNVGSAVVYGGVSQHRQEIALRELPSLLVATPGRLLDLIGQKLVSLAHVEIFVLDEADRMLDMGFLPDVRRIVNLIPRKRQTLFFSATMPAAVESLARGLLVNPVRVAIEPRVTSAAGVDQSVVLVDKANKRAALEELLQDETVERALVFTRTKSGANRLAERLVKSGFSAAAIHGDKSQGARERALGGFKSGTVRVLVATDVAARGIDVENVSLVVNFDVPNEPESYVHRIGRAGRAGATGRAVSLCDPAERGFLNAIEKLLKRKLPAVASTLPPAPPPPPQAPRQPRSRANAPQAHPRANAPQAQRPRDHATKTAPARTEEGSTERRPRRRRYRGARI